jgi:membrane-associated phospholipid phosphatase
LLCAFLAGAGASAPRISVAQDSLTFSHAAAAIPQADSRKPPALKLWEAGAVVGGGLLTMAVVDGPVQEWTRDPHGTQATADLANTLTYFGQWQVVVPVTGGLILVGLAAKQPWLLHAGYRVGASVLVAGAVTEVFKLTLGRVRPADTDDQWDFKPFSGNTSMWSGHTVVAFSFATALSQEIHRPWATVGLYTLATGTAWARVYGNHHWVSDVMVGAAVGIASAKLATGRLTIFGLRAPVPLATRNGFGLMWHGTF